MRISFLAAALLILLSVNCFSQKGKTYVGIQYKPIFPMDLVGTGKIVNDTAGVQFETTLNSGFNSGLVIRHNFTSLIAFESGISYVKRKYKLDITDGDFKGTSYFRSISYEVPALFMVYAQLGEKIYITGSMGVTLDLFPSSITTEDYYFYHVAFRNHVVNPAIAANLGWEYRTEKSGIIYLGLSFQRPFSSIYFSKILYDGNQKSVVVLNELSGSYLTVDLRFYFPETKTKKSD